MQVYDEEQSKISEINFDSYSIDLNNFNRLEDGFLYADEKSTIDLLNKVLSKTNNNEEFGVLHNRFSKALYIFSLVFLPLVIFKMIKKPDDNSIIIISSTIIIGILIKFFEITMESLLIEKNELIILNYLIPILINFLIILFLYLNINYVKEVIKK